MSTRSERLTAPVHGVKHSATPKESHRPVFRAALLELVAKVRDGVWVTRGRELHS